MFYETLKNDDAFTAAVPVLQTASVTGLLGKKEVLDVSEHKVGILVWSTHDPALAHATMRVVDLYVYDRPGSFLGIENALLLARRSLEGAVPITDDSGTIFDIAWNGDTNDFWDFNYNAITRSSAFTVHGTGER